MSAVVDNGGDERWPVGEMLRVARVRRRWSMRRAAREAGLSATRYQQIEQGVDRRLPGGAVVPASPPVDTLARVAHALGLDPVEAVRAAGLDPADIVVTPAVVEEWETGDQIRLVVEGMKVADAETRLIIETLARRALRDAEGDARAD